MKKIAVLAVALAMASLSQASELWWTVASDATVDGASIGTWDTAKVYVSDNGYNYGGSQLGSDIAKTDLDDWGWWNTDITGKDNSSWSFYVELYNSDTLVGKSYVSKEAPQQGATPYDTLNSANAIYNGVGMNPTATAYSFSSFTTSDVIPEPTSGLMVLLGMMALGLKRKRV